MIYVILNDMKLTEWYHFKFYSLYTYTRKKYFEEYYSIYIGKNVFLICNVY